MQKELKVGDVIPAGPLLGSVTKEEVSLMVTSTSKDKIGYEATFMGVFLGKATELKTKGGSKWKWA